jgi:hypothetical protein
LTMNIARLALLYTGVCLTAMKSSKPQYCLLPWTPKNVMI